MEPFHSESPAGGQPRLTLEKLVSSLNNLHKLGSDTELHLIELGNGEILFEQGEQGDSLYLLIAGVLGVRVRHEDGSESEIDRLAPGAVVGEMALLSEQRRTATVYAINDASLMRLSRAEIKQLIKEDPGAETLIEAEFDARWQRLQLARVLKQLWGDLDAAALHGLQADLEWLQLSNGEVVFRQGDPPDGLYIVVSGRLRVAVTSPDGEERLMNEVAPGETVGELALLSENPRTATVFAVRESSVVRLRFETFEKLVRANPKFMRKITGIIVERQQHALSPARRRSSIAQMSIALVPAGPGVDVGAFAQELAEALRRYGTSEVMDGGRFDAQYGQVGASQTPPDDPKSPAVAAWLEQYAADHAFVLLAADAGPSAWTRRCLGHADRVLLVADPQEDPRPGAAPASWHCPCFGCKP